MKAVHIVEMLESMIHSRSFPNGRLPPVRDLGHMLETSVPTVCKALKVLQEKRLLEQLPKGSGYYITGGFPSKTQFHLDKEFEAARGHERIALRLKERILAGEFTLAGRLPTFKELQRHYGCSYRTVSKAFVILQERYALVKEQGRGFLLAGIGNKPERTSAVYLAGTPAVLTSYRDSFFLFLAFLEKGLARLGWGSLRYYLSHAPDKKSAPPDHEVAAFIHLIHGPTKGWGTFFNTKRNVPIIFIDFDDIPRGQFQRHVLYIKIRPSSRRAGTEVGIHLHSLGHRRIAFFSHVAGDDYRWVTNRANGLADVYTTRTHGATSDGMVLFLNTGPELRVRNTELANLVSRFHQAFHNSPQLTFESIKFKSKGLYDLSASYGLALAMEPLFKKAWDDKSITAWVCVNDDVASVARAYCNTHRIRVPEDISIAGFDNSPISFLMNQTSYDFNVEGIAQTALRILASPHQIRPDEQHIITIPGQLVSRSSTCRARVL